MPIKESLLNQLPIFANHLPTLLNPAAASVMICFGILINNNLNACLILSKTKSNIFIPKVFTLLTKSENEDTFLNISKKLVIAVLMLSIILANGSKVFAMVFVSIKPSRRPEITEDAAEITLSPNEETCPTILSALNQPVKASNTLIIVAIT